MCETPLPKTLTLSYVEKGSEMSGRPFAEVEMWYAVRHRSLFFTFSWRRINTVWLAEAVLGTRAKSRYRLSFTTSLTPEHKLKKLRGKV